MMRVMSRDGWFAVGAVFVVACSVGHASAQDVPAPPPAYASASIGVDLVLEPLVSAAEADLSRGEIVMALARTQVVLAEAPASTSVRVRAEGLTLLARQRLGATVPGPVGTDDAYAPIVSAASDDVAAARFELGRARLGWIAAHVPPESALALRARAVLAALEARAASGPAPTAPPPTVATVVVPPPTATAVAPTSVVAPPTWPSAPGTPPEPETPEDPRRRADVEIVDLYITGGLMGAYLGAWIPESARLLEGMAGDEQTRVLAFSMLGGAGVLTLGILGLDQIDHGPRSGQPTSIATGIRFGFVLGGLTLGVLSARSSYSTGEQFDAMGIGLLGGALVGTVFAYAAEPHPSQVQFTQTSGLWGGILGAELATLVAPLAFPNFGADRDRMEAGFGITLAGLSTGILTGVVLSAAHEHFSSRRSWLTTLGMLAGTGAGTLIWLLVTAATGTFDAPTWGGISAVGSLGGFILATVLTERDAGPREWDATAPSAVQVSLTPTLGGASVGISGGF